MDVIDGIITDILKAEGWDKYTNHPADRGGPTKWGITAKAWSEAIGRPATEDDVRRVSEADARAFYRAKYILAPNFHKVSPLVMPLLIDCGVNHGVERAAKWYQKVVGAEQDGVIGPKTLAAAALLPAMTVYLLICAERIRFYGVIVSRDHSQAEFASGWNNRAAKFLVSLADMLKAG